MAENALSVTLKDRLARYPIKELERKRTKLSPEKEQAFQKWYRGWADRAGIDQDPDNPLHKYDYRGAFKSGQGPEKSSEDGLYHWPSEFKDDDHPNRFVDGVDTKTGKTIKPKDE